LGRINQSPRHARVKRKLIYEDANWRYKYIEVAKKLNETLVVSLAVIEAQ
jgi:hypothetical protein